MTLLLQRLQNVTVQSSSLPYNVSIKSLCELVSTRRSFMRIPCSRVSGRKRFYALVSTPLFSLLVFVAAITLQNSYAQQNVGDDSTEVYPASYFAEWAPVTAQDMLNRIPGMQRSSGSNRGGSFRNVQSRWSWPWFWKQWYTDPYQRQTHAR